MFLGTVAISGESSMNDDVSASEGFERRQWISGDFCRVGERMKRAK